MTHFGADNFTVTLEWSQFSGETYSVATVPESEHMTYTMNRSIQLAMRYNTQYNVTVTATLCGHRNAINLMVIINNTHVHASKLDSQYFSSISHTIMFNVCTETL
jgi:hypothetical protein